MTARLSDLARLESELIHVLHEAVAEARNPVMLFSAGKDSTVLAHLALRAFFPGKPPFPLLHIDSTWEFQSLLEFRQLRPGRISDGEDGGSLEQKKREGYF